MVQQDAAHGADATPEPVAMTRSHRDPEQLRDRLEAWLATRLPAAAAPRIEKVEIPSSNGMSSETVLLDATWDEGGAPRREALVARIAPDPGDVPVFPSYDLDRQFRVMREVGDASDVPVPRVFWSEPDAGPVGAPFFVMQRVEGQVPPDVMPYPYGSWVTEATPEQRAVLQESSVRVLAQLHAIERPEERFAFLADSGASSPLRRHVEATRRYYDWVVSDGVRSPLIERGFDWLDEHWPTDEGPAVLSWGDSRIGNMMYVDCRPVAVLDWEMAALAPREVDLAWFIFLHRFFQDLCDMIGVPGLPDFLRRDEVAAQYEEMSGYRPRDLDFHTMYAALRHAVVMFRVYRRQVYFGEAEMPDDPDAMILHRPAVERMLEGSYWSALGLGD